MAVEGFDDRLQRRADPAIDCSGCGPSADSAGLGETRFGPMIFPGQDASGK